MLADDSQTDPTAARQFDKFPLYWVGERFERWDLAHIELAGPADFVTFVALVAASTALEERSAQQ